MGYWSSRDQGGAPKSSEGWHRYQVTKVLHGTKERDFESSKGDPQMMVILTDEQGAEASVMFTLNDKAAWVLARFLSRAGIELDQLDEKGVTLHDFEDNIFACKYLADLEVWANCEHELADNGKTYTKLHFYSEDEIPPSILAQFRGDRNGTTHNGSTFSDGAPVPDDSDIPF